MNCKYLTLAFLVLLNNACAHTSDSTLFEKTRKIEPGKTSYDSMVSILNKPHRTIEEEKTLAHHYAIAKSRSGIEIPKLIINTNKKSNLVESYVYFFFHDSNNKFANLNFLFPNQKFTQISVDNSKLHYIPSNKFYTNEDSTISFEYWESTDTINHVSVSALENKPVANQAKQK